MKQGRIFKSRKEKNYTQICNSVLDRGDLSWQAKGLICFLLRQPDDWKVYKSQIQTKASNGREAFETAWRELEVKGYIIKGDQVKEGGKFKGNDFMVYEVPADAGNPQRFMSETRNGTDAGNPQLLILTNTTNTITKKASPFSLDDRKKNFGMSLQPFEQKYGKQMLKDFYLYWTESDGKRMQFEITKAKRGVFELSRRLATWKKNNEKFEAVTQELIPEKASMPETYHTLR